MTNSRAGLVEEYAFGDWSEDDGPEKIPWVDVGECVEEFIHVFETWPQRVNGLSRDVQNRALWRILSGQWILEELLEAGAKDADVGSRLIRAMRGITEAVPVVTPPGEPMENGYFMWWDCVCDDLEEPRLIQSCLEVLTELLQNLDANVQWCALHGLGHLKHPRRAEVVSEFMARFGRDAYDEEEWRWILACRDGTVA